MKKILIDLQEYVSEISKAYKDRDAYRYIVDGTIAHKSFKDLERDVNAVASWFVNNGWSGRHVAIIGSTSYNWVVTFLGITCSSNVVIPIDRMLSSDDILNLISMGDTDTVFVSSDFEHLIPLINEADNPVTDIISFADPRFSEILLTERVPLPKIDPGALAEILFTSGTTGVSKGVMLSHRCIVSNISDIYRMNFAQNLKKDPVVMSILPIHHTFELTVDNLGVLYCGATVCINDKIENIVENLNKFKPSVILIVPAIAETFYRRIMESISSGSNKRKIAYAKRMNKVLRTFNIDARRKIYKSILDRFGGDLTNVIVGGAALRPEIAEAFDEFGVNMYQGYGLTECAPLISANYPRKNKVGSVGKPVSYMKVKIDHGEIIVKGPGVMIGYYKNPEATADAFTKDGWLRTGDLGAFDEEGYLYITGRSKNLIILDNGKNIYPEELETQIGVIDGVKEVLVYENKGKICAAIHPSDLKDKELTKNIKLKIKELNNSWPSYKKIVSIAFVTKDFPKTTTLKIKRNEAINMVRELISKKAVEYVAPSTTEQKLITSVFEQVLDSKRVGIKEDFFDLGGDSLAAFEAAALLGIQAQEIYENPTPEQLEAVLISAKNAADADSSGIDVNAIISREANLTHTVKEKNILLTGATGFLGAHILRELQKRQANVVCLVRSEEKLQKTLEYYFPKTYKTFKYGVAVGDIEKECFGLSSEDYATLADKTTIVIHTAANVSHAGHYSDFERTNVLGTQNVIDFCKAADAVLHHTSTASVHGAGTVEQRRPDLTFDEFCLDIGQKYSQNVYIHSKYKAEERVLIARNEGLKANIYRIGNLTWRNEDGMFQKNAGDNGFLGRCRGLLKVGKYSAELAQYPIDFTPVDECACAYVKLALSDKVNNVYNLYNPYTYTIQGLGRKLFKRFKCVSREELDKTLKAKITDKDVAVLSFYASIASASANIPMNNDFTVKRLRKLGFKWSKIGLSYLKHMAKFK